MYRLNASTTTALSVVPSARAFASAASHTSVGTRTARGVVTPRPVRAAISARQRRALTDREHGIVGHAHVVVHERPARGRLARLDAIACVLGDPSHEPAADLAVALDATPARRADPEPLTPAATTHLRGSGPATPPSQFRTNEADQPT